MEYPEITHSRDEFSDLGLLLIVEVFKANFIDSVCVRHLFYLFFFKEVLIIKHMTKYE